MVATDVDDLKECFDINVCNNCGEWKAVINVVEARDVPKDHERIEKKGVCVGCLSQAVKELCNGR